MILQATVQTPVPVPPNWVTVLVKMLEWPFLFFIVLLAFVLMFRASLTALLGRGEISIAWGERSIRLVDLSTNLDKELDPLREEIEELKQRLYAIETFRGETAAPPNPQASITAKERIQDALRNGKYDWRSIERLASIGGVSEAEARDILQADPEVVLSVGKSGSPIAGLKSRVRR